MFKPIGTIYLYGETFEYTSNQLVIKIWKSILKLNYLYTRVSIIQNIINLAYKWEKFKEIYPLEIIIIIKHKPLLFTILFAWFESSSSWICLDLKASPKKY